MFVADVDIAVAVDVVAAVDATEDADSLAYCRSASLSWITARMGAKPVPGPTSNIGVHSGGEKKVPATISSSSQAPAESEER